MNSQKLEKYLKQKMKTNTFTLTKVINNATKQITNGNIGYQITAGLWLKLRIYTCLYINEELVFEEVLNESFWTFE